MRRLRYVIAPAAAVLMLGFGGPAHADRYSLSFGSPGAFIHYDSGYKYHGGHYHRRHYYKPPYHVYPRYSHGRRYGHYRHWRWSPRRHYGHGFGHRYGHGYGHQHHRYQRYQRW